MGEWIPYLQLLDDSQVAVNPTSSSILAGVANTPATVALIGLDGVKLAQGVTGTAPPLSEGSPQLWLWSVPLRSATKWVPAVMCLEVSGALRASGGSSFLGVFGEDEEDLQNEELAPLLAATLLSCSTIIQPIVRSSDNEEGGGGLDASVRRVLSEWASLQHVMSLLSRTGSKEEGEHRPALTAETSPSPSSAAAAAALARAHMPRLLFAFGPPPGGSPTKSRASGKSARARLEALLQQEPGFGAEASRCNTARALLDALFPSSSLAAAAVGGASGGGWRDAIVLEKEAADALLPEEGGGGPLSSPSSPSPSSSSVVASLLEAVLSDTAPRSISLSQGDQGESGGADGPTVLPASGPMLCALVASVAAQLNGGNGDGGSDDGDDGNGEVSGRSRGGGVEGGQEGGQGGGGGLLSRAHASAARALVASASSLALEAWHKAARNHGLFALHHAIADKHHHHNNNGDVAAAATPAGSGNASSAAAAVAIAAIAAASGKPPSPSLPSPLSCLPKEESVLRADLSACAATAEKVFSNVMSGMATDDSPPLSSPSSSSSSTDGGGGALLVSGHVGKGLSALRLRLSTEFEGSRVQANRQASSDLCAPLAALAVEETLKSFRQEVQLLQQQAASEKNGRNHLGGGGAASEASGAAAENSGAGKGVVAVSNEVGDNSDDDDDDEGGVVVGGRGWGASGEVAVGAAVAQAQRTARAAAQRLEFLKAQLSSGKNNGSTPQSSAAAAAGNGSGGGGGALPFDASVAGSGVSGSGSGSNALAERYFALGAKGPHAWSSLCQALVKRDTVGDTAADTGDTAADDDKQQQQLLERAAAEEALTVSACAAAPVAIAARAHASLRLSLLGWLKQVRDDGSSDGFKLAEVEAGRGEARAKGAASLGECLRTSNRERQELASSVHGLEMEIGELESRSERVDTLRRKKVATAVGRVAEAKRRANLMNAKVAEMHAVASAKLVAAKDHIAGHSISLAQVELAALVREKALLLGHASTLEALLGASQRDLEAKQVKATEVEYQSETALRRGAEFATNNALRACERDSLEELVLKLKLYTLGGVGAMKSGRPPHTTLPPKLASALFPYERQCLDDIFAHI